MAETVNKPREQKEAPPAEQQNPEQTAYIQGADKQMDGNDNFESLLSLDFVDSIAKKNSADLLDQLKKGHKEGLAQRMEESKGDVLSQIDNTHYEATFSDGDKVNIYSIDDTTYLYSQKFHVILKKDSSADSAKVLLNKYNDDR